MRISISILLSILLLLSCGDDNKTNRNTNEHIINGNGSPYDIRYQFPKHIKDVDELSLEQKMDTSNANMNWILDMYANYVDGSAFYDSLNSELSFYVKSGNRVDISNSERNKTYLTVPTVPLESVMPSEIENGKMVFDSGKKRHKDKVYYQRSYEIDNSDNILDFYYISTELQSTLVIMNSKKLNTFRNEVLAYEVFKRN
jgi:hypothetical protein